MKSKKSHNTKHKREFGGCVELIPTLPDYTEFIDAHRLWCFPIHHLTHFVLQENPDSNGQKNIPPDQLILLYPPATVVLKGWRLELLVGPLVSGRVARVHAEKHLGALILEEAWVSEIYVLLREDLVLDQESLEQFISQQYERR
jgi:hypothetical protein